MINDNEEIIEQKNYRYWSGKGKDIPLRYCVEDKVGEVNTKLCTHNI